MDDFLMTLPERVAPAHTAIVVIDMQNDFCAKDGYLDSHSGVDEGANKALAGRIMDLVEAGRRAGTEIVWVQAIYDPKYMPPPFLVRRRERGIDAVCCAEGTWGAEFYEMSPKDDEIFIEKHRYSAFCGTRLDNILRVRGIKTVVVTGVATSVCVESTFRDAYNLGYYIVMPRDCVSGGIKDLHEATIKNVEIFFGDAPEGAGVIDIWANGRAANLKEAG